ncbi:MAG: hypothetical protein DRI39_00845 [Chloroflexi bacterium]|nr:MAG: hypothetical protein DRI39_00845 [Chloroflexota bacterium]
MLEITNLVAREPEGIVITFASLAYNRSQGISLPENSNIKFIDFIRDEVWKQLSHMCTREIFEDTHQQWIEDLRDLLKQRNGLPISYGQGQESLNVWLKFYVDWASLPEMQVAERLRPWLHCPLDNVVMGKLKDIYPDEYQIRIVPHYRRLGLAAQERHSLSKMDKELYFTWQGWIREISPDKPLLVDLIWAFER